MRNTVLLAAAASLLATAIHAQTGRENPTADYALINGSVYTMDGASTIAEAIGIEDGKIVYVGNAEGLPNVIG